MYFSYNCDVFDYDEIFAICSDFFKDLETVQLTKAEFINLLMESKLFTTLTDLFGEREEEDEDFFVCFYFFIYSFVNMIIKNVIYHLLLNFLYI